MNKRQGIAITACIIILASAWCLLFYGYEFWAGLCLGVAATNMPWIISTTD